LLINKQIRTAKMEEKKNEKAAFCSNSALSYIFGSLWPTTASGRW
jgi:hypothetical protein